jgi:hypothetical protein
MQKYRPGMGQTVISYKRDDGVYYSGWKEYHGPWPAPPEPPLPLYDHPQPETTKGKIERILKQYDIEMELLSYEEIMITFRYKGELIADNVKWTDYERYQLDSLT